MVGDQTQSFDFFEYSFVERRPRMYVGFIPTLGTFLSKGGWGEFAKWKLDFATSSRMY